jgi:4-amino-4-deoxy-L-arabinose transferase-like glycosyltransferase
MKPATYAALLLVVAFLVRLVMVLSFGDIRQGPAGLPTNDDVQFNNIAWQLAQGNGYRSAADARLTAFRAPGYPFFLAGLYMLFGENAPLIYLSHCLLGALACVLTWLLVREVLSERGARLAGVLGALYLPHAYVAAVFISENLFVPLFALGILLAIRFLRGGSGWMLVLAGLVLGYATLTRPFTLLMLLITLAIAGWARWRGRRVPAWPLPAFAVVFLAVLAPWTYRNYLVFDRFVLVATNGGSTFWGSNNDRVATEPRSLGYWVATNELPHRDKIDAAPDEVTHDQVEWQLGKEWVRNNLSRMPLLELYKLLRLWWLPEYGAGLRWLRIVSYVPYLLLFVLGAWRCLRCPQCWTLSWAMIHGGMVALFVTVLIFSGLPRFRDANMPLSMLYAAVGLVPVRDKPGPV